MGEKICGSENSRKAKNRGVEGGGYFGRESRDDADEDEESAKVGWTHGKNGRGRLAKKADTLRVEARITRGRPRMRWERDAAGVGGEWRRRARGGGVGGEWRRRARGGGVGGEWRRRARDGGVGGEWRRRARGGGVGGEWRTRARDGGLKTGGGDGSERGSVTKKK